MPIGRGLRLRVNGLRTRQGLEDVLALSAVPRCFDYLMVPKVEHPEDLVMLHRLAAGRFRRTGGADRIADRRRTGLCDRRLPQAGAPRLRALMLGGADLSHELGARFDWGGLLHARGRLVNAARAAGLQAWDVPHLDSRMPTACG